MKLSILIPAFNEEERIASTLSDVMHFLEQGNIDSEIIVVDDGSFDATEFVSTETLKKTFLPSKVVRLQENKGKGFAIATAIRNATGDYMLFMDADGSTQIKELVRFFPLVDKSTLIIGSRQKDKNLLLISQPPFRKALGEAAKFFHKTFFRLGVEDSQCGFKLLPKSLAISFIRKPFPNRWGFDIALIHYALQCGFKVEEVGVQWKDSPGSKVRPFADIFKTVFELLKYKIKSKQK